MRPASIYFIFDVRLNQALCIALSAGSTRCTEAPQSDENDCWARSDTLNRSRSILTRPHSSGLSWRSDNFHRVSRSFWAPDISCTNVSTSYLMPKVLTTVKHWPYWSKHTSLFSSLKHDISRWPSDWHIKQQLKWSFRGGVILCFSLLYCLKQLLMLCRRALLNEIILVPYHLHHQGDGHTFTQMDHTRPTSSRWLPCFATRSWLGSLGSYAFDLLCAASNACVAKFTMWARQLKFMLEH